MNNANGKRQLAPTKRSSGILLVTSMFCLIATITNPALAADVPASANGQVVLQEQSAQIDNAQLTPIPIPTPTPTPTSISTPTPPHSAVHELKVSKGAQRDIQEGGAPKQLAPSSENFSSSAGIDVGVGQTEGQSRSAEPLSALKGSSEDSPKTVLQGFAQRDTTYGVCGISVGLQLFSKAYATIEKVYPGLPASDAGLESGDTILSINGRSTRGIPPRAVWDWLTGRPGTTVNILVERDGEQFGRTLTRFDIGHIANDRDRQLFLTLFRKNGVSRLLRYENQD
jgi:PDZ domain